MNLKELSETLGLSQTTVSRALNGYPEVSEATRQRVHVAAEAHGYLPNARARSLATGCSMSVGHILPVSTQSELVNPVFADFLAGASETYSAAGYNIHLSMVPDSLEAETYKTMARQGTVDGVIVHAPQVFDDRIELLSSLGMPFVVHGRASKVVAPYSWLDVNNTDAFRRATALLMDLGHRRIALLNGRETMDFAMRRRAGFLKAFAERKLEADESLMRSEDMTEAFGYDSAVELLKRSSPPTAFLVSSVIPAYGVRRAIEEAGLRVGKDVSVVVHDDDLSYFGSGNAVPFFTAVRSPVREAGRQVAEMLLAQISNPSRAEEHRLLEAELTVGLSTCPAPDR